MVGSCSVNRIRMETPRKLNFLISKTGKFALGRKCLIQILPLLLSFLNFLEHTDVKNLKIWITFPCSPLCYGSQFFSLSFQVCSVLCKFSLTLNLLQPPIVPFPPHLTNPTNCLPLKFPWSVFQVSQKVSCRTKGRRSGSITPKQGAVQVHLIIWSWLVHE